MKTSIDTDSRPTGREIEEREVGATDQGVHMAGSPEGRMERVPLESKRSLN